MCGMKIYRLYANYIPLVECARSVRGRMALPFFKRPEVARDQICAHIETLKLGLHTRLSDINN